MAIVSTPFQSTYNEIKVVTPNPVIGSATDALLFFNSATQLATAMVVGQFYTVVTVGTTNFGTYGTLQTNVGSGVANTVGAVYKCTSNPATGTGTVTPTYGLSQAGTILTNASFAVIPATAYSGLTNTTPYGFSSLANAQAVVAFCQALQNALLALNLINS